MPPEIIPPGPNLLMVLTLPPLTAIKSLIVRAGSLVVDTVDALAVAFEIGLGGEAAVVGAVGFVAAVGFVDGGEVGCCGMGDGGGGGRGCGGDGDGAEGGAVGGGLGRRGGGGAVGVGGGGGGGGGGGFGRVFGGRGLPDVGEVGGGDEEGRLLLLLRGRWWWRCGGADGAFEAVVARDVGLQDDFPDRKGDVLHVFREVIAQFLPRITDGAAEFAGLVFRALGFFFPAFFHQGPDRILFPKAFDGGGGAVVGHFERSGIGPGFGLGHFVFADQVLDEIIFAVADMRAVDNVAYPALELSMPFILMPDPVRFPFERLGVRALIKGAYEWLEVLAEMLRPVGWFETFLDLEAKRALELRGETLGGRQGVAGRKRC